MSGKLVEAWNTLFKTCLNCHGLTVLKHTQHFSKTLFIYWKNKLEVRTCNLEHLENDNTRKQILETKKKLAT